MVIMSYSSDLEWVLKNIADIIIRNQLEFWERFEFFKIKPS